MKKNIFTRAWTGIKKGYSLPTLPSSVLLLQKNPFIRILRVLGGISLLSLLGRGFFTFNFDGLYLYISYFFAFLLVLYNFYIAIQRYKHMKKVLKSKEVEIRNSPLDRFASSLLKTVFCWKGLCETAGAVGSGLGFMLGTDTVLKESGREPFFGPILAEALNLVLPKNDAAAWRAGLNRDMKYLDSLKEQGKIFTAVEADINNNSSFSEKEKAELKEFLQLVQEANDEDIIKTRDNITNSIKSQIKDKDKEDK